MRTVKMFNYQNGNLALIFYLEGEQIAKIKNYISGGDGLEEYINNPYWRYERDDRGEFLIYEDKQCHVIQRNLINYNVLKESK